MSRTISSSLLTALTGDLVEPFYAVELFFDNGTLRFWTGIGDRTIAINGTDQTFTGTGSLLSIGPADEVSDLAAKSMSLSLTGLDSAIISLALQEPYQRRIAKIYLGEQTVSDVMHLFSGFMDTMDITDDADVSTIQLTIESRLVELERASNWRYTDESHKTRQSGDTFFSYVQGLQDAQIAWGRKS